MPRLWVARRRVDGLLVGSEMRLQNKVVLVRAVLAIVVWLLLVH